MSKFQFYILSKEGCSPATIAAFEKYQTLAAAPIKDAAWETRWQNFVEQDNGFGLAMVAINIVAKYEY